MPTIISGPTIAFMEPQGKVWPKQSGRQFNITQPKMPPTLAPFDGISGFSIGMPTYLHTLFRFPLRQSASKLSDKCYDIDKLKDLLEALKEEAQYLLLFLRSVDIIHVFEIGISGNHSKLFEVSISEQERETVAEKRRAFLKELKSSNPKTRKKPYEITYDAQFHVKEEEMGSSSDERHWLVTTIVGSNNPNDLLAATKQKVLPWVGCALELDKEPTNDSGGRIFCFLPLPQETRSPLPVHVNGTFGLNDDRRSLKWPSGERKHDSTADWNMKIVLSLLPPCYALLIKSAIKLGLPPHYVYSSWPQMKQLKHTNWSGLMQPLLEILFEEEVFWSVNTHLNQGMWVSLHTATFIDICDPISPAVHRVLSACGLQLVELHQYEHIWHALGNRKMTRLSPALTRQKIRALQKETGYKSLVSNDKHELLNYCLSDGKYNELEGLQLLPLVDESFVCFEQVKPNCKIYFICDERHPRGLLPNMDNCLVDLSKDKLSLHKELLKVASSQKTQLQKLNPTVVAELLPKCMPPGWSHKNVVPISGSHFPPNWFELFWKWVTKQNLDLFKEQMILPVAKANCKEGDLFWVSRLVTKSKVIFISEGSALANEGNLIRGLQKLDVYFTGATDGLFPYLQHQKSLMEFTNSASPHGVLNAVANAVANTDGVQNLQTINFTTAEAESIQHFLRDIRGMKEHSKEVLLHLPIFKCVNHEKLYSIAHAADQSWNKRAVMTTSFKNTPNLLPPKLVVLIDDHNQRTLSHIYRDKIDTPTMISFILDYLIPMIIQQEYPQSRLEDLMENILHQLPSLKYEAKGRKEDFLKKLKKVPFLKKGDIFVPPCQLFDPSKKDIADIFEGEPVFPQPPFDNTDLLPSLRECGLRKSVEAQEVVEVVLSIATKPVNQVKVSRARAVLKYLDNNTALLEDPVKYGQSSQTLKKILCALAEQKEWLPLQVSPPEQYPSCLKWKGGSCSTQLVRQGPITAMCSPERMRHVSLVAGSEMYAVSCPSRLCGVFKSIIPVKMIIKHFKQVIAAHKDLDEETLDEMVYEIYKCLNSKPEFYPEAKKNLPSHWIWIKHKFLSTKSVSLKPNPNLQRDLEPYVYILPETLQKFSKLFKAMGVKECITQSHLLSVLHAIKRKDSAEHDSELAWATVMDILTSLTSHGQKEVSLSSREILYVPTDSTSLHLEDSRNVCFADVEFLKDFVVSKKELDSEDSEERYVLCHDQITHLAHSLHLTPLSEYFDISDDLFEDFGQHEPLVLRLKNILRDYTDGLTIVKELLQNADDAGATEVNLCYDARQHNVDPKTLLYSGMAKSYGPALIVHNDAVFTDEDFQNITKLAAATKQNKPLKIGKFGVGFCSVYHITDVPSFVSREYLYIFDPTLQCLEKQIRDKSRPGKRLKFTQKIATFSNQLVPFNGLNKFDSKKPFKGTMFRFPFRSSSSEISSIQYTEHHIKELIEDIKKSSSKLLLFLQHVRHITVSQIEEGDDSPRLLLDIQRDVTTTVTPEMQVIRCTESSSHDYVWLVGSHKEKLDFCGQERDATASVACQLQSSASSDPQQYAVRQISGEVFCFLPLSLQSGLPVHVSANFAVLNDRTGIRSSKEHGAGANEAEWNVDLMESTIPQAYLNLLLCLRKMHIKEVLEKDYSFYSLWPLKGQLMVHNPWEYLIAPFYYKLAEKLLLFSTYTKAWLTLSESKFLAPGILCKKQGEIPPSVQDIIQILQIAVVDLPQECRKHLPDHSTIKELDFVRIIFEQIDKLAPHTSTRNEVLLLIIQAYVYSDSYHRTDMEEILKGYRCVPCTPDGKELKYCDEVIDHTAFFADLYEQDDGVFPIKEFQEYSTHQALIELGMVTGNLPLSKVAKRTETIQSLYNSSRTKALERTRLILKCVETFVLKPVKSPYISLSSAHLVYDTDSSSFEKLKAIKFLPVQQRPEGYPAILSWKGESSALLAVNELYCGKRCVTLAGSQIYIVCTEKPEQGGCGPIDSRVISKLKMETEPPFSAVVEHLCHIVQEYTTQEGACEAPISKDWIYNICSQIYSFLEVHLAKNNCLDLNALKDILCVWTGSCFVHPNTVARRWKHNGPYLFHLPDYLENKAHVFATLEIKDQFSVEDMVKTMRKMKEDFGCEPISKDCHGILHTLVIELKSRMRKSYNETQGIVCYLPDSDYIMRRADELDYNDAPWCEVDQSTGTFVHVDIPRDFAIKVGVRPVRSKFLDQYEDNYEGEEFGQWEDLTQRIKNILRDYPLDITILKELLQNADDAKATKMYIILDKRTHGMDTLPSDEWKDLQGPALLVWNDSTFQREDFKGIQKLGLGSKRSEAETIGMYGIGFNAVYHLTDCPSFISTEKDGKSTLCVLDPHCRYIPGAKELRPGRRFNNLDQKFWKQWSDLRSAYFQDNIPGLPSEMKSGSLFRFPLRHSQELIDKSELLESSTLEQHKPLQAWKMQEKLNKWAPDMKGTLFFLNNVTEIRFFVVDNDGQLHATHWYVATINEEGKKCRSRMQNKVHHFGMNNLSPHTERYMLTLTDKLAGCREGLSEKWYIQQGIGDIHNPKQHWQYLPQMKPKHGIAAPLCTPDKACEKRLHSRVFCFLPLPVSAHLPVHVNGSFVLDSSRRKLWQPTNPNYLDNKTKWNNCLMEAIASSYVEFLIELQDAYIDPSGSDSEDALLQSIMQYYSTFPIWLDENPPEGQCLTLAKIVYAKLYQHNASVLVHVRKEKTVYKADYLPLYNEQQPQDQAYFYEETMSEEVVSILRKIGMHLTAAPQLIHEHFLALQVRLPEVTRHSVFTYYAAFHSIVSPTASFPHPITDTKFGSVKKFKAFTNYLLELSNDEETYGTCQFPSPPYGIPLLLTADNHLKKFDKKNKTIKSKFSSLFQESSERFLHPEMMDVMYLKDYFLKPSADKSWHIVCDIMSHTLPEQLKCSVVLDASEYMDFDVIKHLWRCFSEDPFFNVHLKSVIETWAVIPSTQSQLFSLRSNILPIMMVADNQFSSGETYPTPGHTFEKVYTILEKLSMPILDRDTVHSEEVAKKFCPLVSQPATIVKNLYYLHQERKVLDNTALLQSVVKILLEYFGTIHLAYHPTILHMIKLLPLFKNIDGRFCPIPYGAFIWPGHICSAGRELWLQGDRCVHVFLDGEGDWTYLKAKEALNIKQISPFGVYNKYIFPIFEHLSQQQMMDHLENIRDHLLDDAEQCSKSLVDDRRKDAKEFVQYLKVLNCLQKSDGKFRPVYEFVDPEKRIFKEFGTHFNFPPQEMQAEPWLKFLRRIGLRTNITTKEYLQFCYELERGSHSDIPSASQTLLEYLFQEKDWHKDNDFFLGQVSKIPFVCAESLPSVSWITSCAPPEKTVIAQRRTVVHLTSLHRAADHKDYKFVWTVKPVVRLPSYPYEYTYQLAKQKRSDLLRKLRVKDVTVDNVVQNIKNISDTKFSDFRMFDTYTCKPPKQGESLFCILQENFVFLKDAPCTPITLSPLKNVPCIPVCAEGTVDNVTHPVLVKPLQVIALTGSMLSQFRPFLNPLPNDLYSILPHLLAPIGVEQVVMLKHVQGALQTIHTCTEQPLDVNTQEVVRCLIHKLYELLSNREEVVNSETLRPLYLPTLEDCLVDSTTLLYLDSGHFRRKNFKFTESIYSQLSFLVSDKDIMTRYKFHEKQLCHLLPLEIAPKPLSTSCKEIMSGSCHVAASLSPLAQGLTRAFSHQTLLTKGACAILKHNSNSSEMCKRLKHSLETFFRNTIIFTVKHLTVDVWLTIETPSKCIGTAEVDFHMKKKDNNAFELYIDEAARKIFFYETLSNAIMSLAAEVSGVAMKDIKEPQKTLMYLLKAESSSEVRGILKELNVPFDDTGIDATDEDPGEAFNPNLEPKLGSPIPESWHHRLQQDINNLFRPGEWVGYEEEDDVIVFALIGYRIKNKEEDIEQDIEPYTKYLIYVEEGESEGIEVSVITLYKILRSARREQERNDEQCLVVYEGTGDEEVPREVPQAKNLTDIKREICTELRRIWSLPEDLKKKGLKRLYLKWHPDKNLDNPSLAEEAFKFLKQQIARLEAGKPLDDPEKAEDHTTHDYASSFWESWFEAWNNTAHRHYHYQRSEQRWFSGSDGGRPGGRQYDFNSSAFAGPSPDPYKARVWIRQAECDFKALKVLSSEMRTASEVCANVCFLAHEVAEKSLKAGMLAACGLHSADFSSHRKLYSYACALEQIRPALSAKGLLIHVAALPLEEYYYKTRWPNHHSSHQVPADQFGEGHAREAEMNADAILNMMQTVVDECN